LAPPGGCLSKVFQSFSLELFEAVRSSRGISRFCGGDRIFIP
jgi:hypothetical protein